MVEHHGEFRASAEAKASAAPAVIRGEASWTFLYVVTGFAVSIEGTLISMLEPVWWWVRALLFIAAASGTLFALLLNGRVQDRLFRVKARYEAKPR